MLPALEIFRANRVQRVVDEFQDQRQLPQELFYLRRTPSTPAMESEITGRWLFRAQISDLIALDSEARTYRHGQVSLQTFTPAKLKIGMSLNEQTIRDILNYGGLGINGEVPEFAARTRDRMVRALIQGDDWRRESLLVACYLDGVSYNRMGIKITANWGMPADLKLVPVVSWLDEEDADPVGDIWSQIEIRRIRYGRRTNQIVMSTEALRRMIRTASFQRQAAIHLPQLITFANLNLSSLPRMRELAQSVLEIDEIVLYDGRSWSEDANGIKTSERFQPINYVVLRDSADDNNAAVIDWANCWVTEALLGAAVAFNGTDQWRGFGEARYGPYVNTHIAPHLDPPTLQAWVTSFGWPRKTDPFANSWIRIAPDGAMADSIPVTDIVLP